MRVDNHKEDNITHGRAVIPSCVTQSAGYLSFSGEGAGA